MAPLKRFDCTVIIVVIIPDGFLLINLERGKVISTLRTNRSINLNESPGCPIVIVMRVSDRYQVADFQPHALVLPVALTPFKWPFNVI